MKVVEAQIDISINLECPYCNEYLDLLNHHHFQDLHDDGFIYDQALGANFFGCKDFNQKVSCPACGKKIKISKINY